MAQTGIGKDPRADVPAASKVYQVFDSIKASLSELEEKMNSLDRRLEPVLPSVLITSRNTDPAKAADDMDAPLTRDMNHILQRIDNISSRTEYLLEHLAV